MLAEKERKRDSHRALLALPTVEQKSQGACPRDTRGVGSLSVTPEIF
jgi:hypothetical protein